jgi:hypothetical protein
LTPPFVGALPLAVAQGAGRVVLVTEEGIAGRCALSLCAQLYRGLGRHCATALLAGKVKLREGARVGRCLGGNVDPERVLALFTPGGAAVRP